MLQILTICVLCRHKDLSSLASGALAFSPYVYTGNVSLDPNYTGNVSLDPLIVSLDPKPP